MQTTYTDYAFMTAIPSYRLAPFAEIFLSTSNYPIVL